jgi:hypothetical protein
MSEDLDKKLRDALRPIDPGENFTASVLATVAAESGPRRRRFWPLVGSIAATLVVAGILTHQWWQERREREGLEAREQVLEALRVTSEKLDIAYQIVNESGA